MHRADEVIREILGQGLLLYMKEHSDIDARKYKLIALLDELVASGNFVRYSVKYSDNNLATVEFWVSESVFPQYKAAYNLDIKSEDIP